MALDKEQELAAVFGIRSIPSLLFIPLNGTPQMAQGAMSKADFKRAIDQLLLNRYGDISVTAAPFALDAGESERSAGREQRLLHPSFNPDPESI